MSKGMQTPFEEKRAILYDTPEVEPFNVRDYVPVREALNSRELYPDEPCLIGTINGQPIIIPMLTMVYRHVAQGEWQGTHWFAAFCSLCNAGMLFDPHVRGAVHHFAAQGYYDAMTILADRETGTYWNHLKGLAIYGPLTGETLASLGGFQHLEAREAARTYPDAVVALPHQRDDDEIKTSVAWNEQYRIAPTPVWDDDDELKDTLGKEDSRLPRYDMGLGIWTDTTRRYYPVSQLYAHQNVILDKIDGRGVVIVMNVDAGVPTAFYLETDRAVFAGDSLDLGSNRRYSSGILYVDGQPTPPERPPQSTIRWYGFSAIFPGCEIFGG